MDEMEQSPAPTGESPAAPADAPASPPAPAVDEAEPAADAAADTAADTSGFLANLVSAMRSVAEQARDENLTDFRSAIDSRVAELESAAAERSDDLRRRADLDIDAVGDWERTEIERARAEAERRVEARRQQLEQQLADHQATSEREMAAARKRLEDHERELTAFFAQLADIRDPAAFVAAAKRMPKPPEVGNASRGASDRPAPAPAETLNQRLAALGVDKDAEAAQAGAGSPSADTADSMTPSGDAPEAAASSTTMDTTETADPFRTPDAPEAESPAEAGRDASLAARLAQLDEGLAPAAAQAPADAGASDGAAGDAASSAGEASTAIVVKGLGSFGAITSFKQALERVDGVHGVTLSLGPTGEFVYRASHAPEFDVAAAIRSVEGEHAEIERADGQIRVTVSRAR